MSLADVDINLVIQNNTNYPQRINIMGGPYNPLDTSNAKTEYRWDVTSLTFTTQNQLTLQYQSVNGGKITVFIQNITPSIQGVVNALNTLNIGYFSSYVSGGSTYISSYNDNIIYGQLNIVNSSNNPVNSNTLAIYDFSQSSFYSNSSSNVSDTSGNNNNATAVTGTGNGTTTTLSNFPYTVGTPSFLNAPNNASHQYSVLLPNSFKFPGVQPFMMMIWFQSSGTFAVGNEYQGLISAEGRNPAVIGYNFFITNIGGYQLTSERYNNSTGLGDGLSLPITTFTANKWMFATFGYDGTNIYLGMYDAGSNFLTNQTPSTANIVTDASWGAMLGLRFNNWLNGEIGYASVYNNWLGYSFFSSIYQQTKATYGY